MALSTSIAKHIEDILKRTDFIRRPWRRGIAGTRVYERAKRAVVVVPTIEIVPPCVRPVEQSVDDYFKKLRDVLAGLSKKWNVSDLFLPGGGSIAIPSWFMEWCDANGIRVHVMDPDQMADEFQYRVLFV